MSMPKLDDSKYDISREALTLGGKAATLTQLIPRSSPQQSGQARQAAAQALHAAFQAARGDEA